MEALYKKKNYKTGQADRVIRAKIKDSASKNNRANLLDSKRRIPLSEVQPSNKLADAVEEDKPQKSRLERLQEWKQQREEAKAKKREHDKKNPPFRPCGSKKQRVTANSKISSSKSIPPVNTSTTNSKLTHDTSVSSKKPPKCSTAAPVPRSSARLAAKHQALASVMRDTKTTKTKETLTRPNTSTGRNKSSVVSTSTSTVKTAHTQPTANKKQATANAARQHSSISRPGRNTITNTKTASSKSGVATNKKMPAKTQTKVCDKRTTRSATSRAMSSKSSQVNKEPIMKSKKSKNSQHKNITKENNLKEEEMDHSSEMPDEPPTPTKRSYVPVHPSPLLKRHVAPVRRETVFLPPYVNDPAWKPGAFQDSNANSFSSDPNFDDVFSKKAFSPFHFTATQNVPENDVPFSYTPEPQQCQFVFKPLPKLNYDNSVTTSSSETASATSDAELTDPPAKKRRRESKRCSKRLERVPIRNDNLNGSSNSESTQSAESQGETPMTSDYNEATSSSHEMDSSDVGVDVIKVSSSRASKRRRSSRRRSRRSIAAPEPTVESLSSDSENVTSVSKDTTSTGLSQEEENKNVGEDGVDFAYFCGLHANVTDKFTQMCREWEEKSNKLEEDLKNDDGSFEGVKIEDVLGQIRTTVCQAQLLMRKKLKQYMSLVDEAQDPTVEKRANADDLQSFWDMVYFQVEDVQKKFDAIEKLEKNGWKEKTSTPAKKRAKKRKVVAKKAGSDSSSSEASERLQAAREKREAQRNRLRELKMAAKRAREQEVDVTDESPNSCGDTQTEEEPLPIAPSPKKSKVAHTPPKASNRQRRCSQRLRSRSVFSPVQSSGSVSCVGDVPTGCLISFSPLKS